MCMRLPAWCDDAALKVAGRAVDMRREVQMENGYVKITRVWERGDDVELTLAMPVRRVYACSRPRRTAPACI